MHKFLPDKMPELQEIQKETGNTIKVPSIFSDAFLERYFGAELVKESWKHFSLALFMAKISILNNNSISDQNIDFLTNISIFEESSIFCQKFYIWPKFLFLDFDQKSLFLIKISIFDQNLVIWR